LSVAAPTDLDRADAAPGPIAAVTDRLRSPLARSHHLGRTGYLAGEPAAARQPTGHSSTAVS
jgi:hypothetical protein